jgi:hypothetical protein
LAVAQVFRVTDVSFQPASFSYRPGLWKPAMIVLAALLSLPIFTIASFLLYPSNEVWQHIRETVLN